jgi:hypothetical protein
MVVVVDCESGGSNNDTPLEFHASPWIILPHHSPHQSKPFGPTNTSCGKPSYESTIQKSSSHHDRY